MTAVDAATQTDALTQIILGVLTLVILAVGAVFAGVMARRAKATSDAVHDADGTSIAEMMERVNRRIDRSDARIDRNDARINVLERDVAKAHRRIDRITTPERPRS